MFTKVFLIVYESSFLSLKVYFILQVLYLVRVGLMFIEIPETKIKKNVNKNKISYNKYGGINCHEFCFTWELGYIVQKKNLTHHPVLVVF
jgi:hypothetical protein